MNTEFVKGQDTKKKIIKTALTLFSTNGYNGTSIRNIAYSIGIKESAIYNHFKNKEDILVSIVNEYSSNPISKTISSWQQDIRKLALKGKVFLKEFAMNYKLLSFDKEQEMFFKFVIIEIMQNQTVREEFTQNFMKNNTKIISEAFFIMMQEELIKQDDPLFLAQEFLSTLFYYRLQVSLFKLDRKNTTPLSNVFEKHVDLFWSQIVL